MASRDECWVQRFVVSDPIKHEKGFTLYKVTSVIFPKKYPETATKVVVWKRYSDFKKLHLELKQIHSKSHQKDKFPPFVKAKYFSRFEEEVIEERRRAALLLLEFIAKYPHLYNTDIFVKFFENGYLVIQEEGTGTLHAGNSLKISENNIKVESSAYSCSSEDGTSCTSDSENVTLYTSKNQDSSFTNPEFQSTREDVYSIFKKEVCLGLSQNENSESHYNDNMKTENGYIAKKLWDMTSSKLRMKESNENPDYCIIAEQYVEEAEIKEGMRNYRAAFDLYKKAISCWLSGVQSDMNQSRRNLIKEKTSTCLLKAEYLANNFLSDEIPETVEEEALPLSELWCPISQLKNYKVLNVIKKVILVMESNTHSLFVPLWKSPSPYSKSKKCILPRGGPYMVNLYAIFDTDNVVYLLTQHISAGKLWDYVTPYFMKGNEGVCMEHKKNGIIGSQIFNFECSLVESFTDLSLTTTTSQSSLNSQLENLTELESDSKSLVENNYHYFESNSENCQSNFEETNANHFKNHNINASQNPLPKEKEECSALNKSDNEKILNISPCPNKKCDVDTSELLERAQALLKSVDNILTKNEIIVNQVESKLKPLIKDFDISKENGILLDDTLFSAVPDTSKHLEEINFTAPSIVLNEKLSQDSSILSLFNDQAENYSKMICEISASKSFENPASAKKLFPSTFSSTTKHLDIESPLSRGLSPVSSGSGNGFHWTCWGHEGNGLNTELVLKWASQLLVAINYAHVVGVIFRDLNPDNILIDNYGNICLTYQCQFPGVEPLLDYDGAKSFYIAPECFSVQSISPAADWWSFGVIIYHLIIGESLSHYHPMGICEHTIIYLPEYVSPEAKSLIKKLLKYDSSQRLGAGLLGVEEIKTHPFFKGVNWEKVYKDGLTS